MPEADSPTTPLPPRSRRTRVAGSLLMIVTLSITLASFLAFTAAWQYKEWLLVPAGLLGLALAAFLGPKAERMNPDAGGYASGISPF